MTTVTECSECGADVELPEDEFPDDAVMYEMGWHPDGVCPGPALARAVRELHHQAHSPADISTCRREPCSWLTTPQITGQPGRSQ